MAASVKRPPRRSASYSGPKRDRTAGVEQPADGADQGVRVRPQVLGDGLEGALAEWEAPLVTVDEGACQGVRGAERSGQSRIAGLDVDAEAPRRPRGAG